MELRQTVSPPTTCPSSSPSFPSVVVLLVLGLPAAGKSSFIRRLSHIPALLVHHVCIDELYNQQSAADSFCPVAWHAARTAAYVRVVELLNELPASAEPADPSVSHVVCVDDVFHLRSMRQVYYRLCRARQVPFRQLLLDTPLASCLVNLDSRSAAAPVFAAHAQLTAPYVAALSERFDWPNEAEMRYTTVESGGSVNQGDCSFLLDALAPPLPLTAHEPSAVHMQSAVHALDLALRRAVGQLVAQRSSQQQQRTGSDVVGRMGTAGGYARAVNELRKRVLRDARKPGTAVYEMMRAADEEVMEAATGERELQPAVCYALAYFGSLLVVFESPHEKALAM